ncbi:gamma-glutamylcyclotransferase [bacterium]|nr:gamma-glutamylcyclotransferase [bacterium]
MAEEARTLYFGYGSNLDRNDWLEWCEEKGVNPSGIEEITPCWLPDYRLKFHYRSSRRRGGAADVVPAGCGHAVPGVLFALSDNALANMDRKEGHPNYYERCNVNVLLPNGTSMEAVTYTLVEHRKGEYVAPTSHYAALVRTGLERRNLPITDLKMAIENSDESYPVPYLFVYGTLMAGEYRSATLEQHTFQPGVTAQVKGTLYNLGNYPGMRPSEEDRVFGELYRLKDVFLGLQSLDRVEGFYGFKSDDSLFKRTLIEVETEEGKVWAWSYIYAEGIDEAHRIQSGDWRALDS